MNSYFPLRADWISALISSSVKSDTPVAFAMARINFERVMIFHTDRGMEFCAQERISKSGKSEASVW